MLLGQVPLVQGIREAGDGGRPAILDETAAVTREAFMNVAQNVAKQVSVRNEMLDPTQMVRVQS